MSEWLSDSYKDLMKDFDKLEKRTAKLLEKKQKQEQKDVRSGKNE